MEEFQFLNLSIWPLFLALLPLLLIVYLAMKKRALALSALGLSGDTLRQKLVRAATLSLIILLSGAALLRPSSGYQEISLPENIGRDVILLIDVSSSMLAKDESPSRLEAARRKAEDSLLLLKEAARGDRLGIVLFAGAAYMYLPPTADYQVARTFIRSIEAGLISAQGSSLTAALERAAESLSEASRKQALLIVMSDGEDQDFSSDKSAELLQAKGLRLSALGFGSTEGSPIDLGSGRLQKDDKGNIVVSRLLAGNLKTLAQAGGGLYQKAGIDDADLRRILRSAYPRTLNGNTGSKKHRNYHELGPLLCALTLIILFLSTLLPSRMRLPGFFILFLLPCALSYQAQADEPLSADDSKLHAAARDYRKGKYEDALSVFERYSAAHPKDPETLQALGSTLYKLGRFDEAARAFQRLKALRDATASKPREKYQASYNLGNAELKAERPENAITSYEEALKIKPNDEAANHNLEIARKTLEEKKKQEQKPSPEPSPTTQQSEEQKQDQSSPEPQANEDNHPRESSEASTPEPEDGPTPSPTTQAGAEPAASPAPSQPSAAERTPEQSGEESEAPPDGQKQQYDSAALSEREAQAWLDSLPEAPVLLQRHSGKGSVGSGQKW